MSSPLFSVIFDKEGIKAAASVPLLVDCYARGGCADIAVFGEFDNSRAGEYFVYTTFIFNFG
jgi:hypothetical protein